MNEQFESRYDKAMFMAQQWGYNGEDAKQVAKHIFAKWITGGKTIGKKDGKLVVNKPCQHRPNLP